MNQMTHSRQWLLAATALTALAAGVSTACADDAGGAPGAYGDWWYNGAAEFGGQVFITKPGAPRQNAQATTDANGNLILPPLGNSAAKFNEYGRRTDPVFLSAIDLQAKRKDGGFDLNLLGAHIGEDNQKLELDLDQPGTQYLSLDWFKTDHIRSNTAQTIFDGVGGSSLTVPNGVVQSLYGGLFPLGTIAGGAGTNVNAASITTSASPNATAAQIAAGYVQNGTPTSLLVNPVKYTLASVPNGCFLTSQAGSAACNGKTPVQTTINNNEKLISLGIQRDRKEIDYRWTPTDQFDVKVSYSHEHRYGVQEQGFLFSNSTSTPMAQVPMPVNDLTQEASITGEYYGTSPWGMKWNGSLHFGTSIYTDAYTQYTVENPFGGPGSPAPGVPNCPVASTTAVPNCYGFGAMDTAPNSAANTVSAQTGVDLPGFKSNRYMGTLQFTDMQQNQTFTAMTVNPGNAGAGSYQITGGSVALAPLPRNSLQGKVDTLLWNNVIATQITSDVKNKLSYRLYNYQNNTPALLLSNWIVNDTSIAAGAGSTGSGSYAPHAGLFQSYRKQNAGDEVTFRPGSWGQFGVGVGWEQFAYSAYAVNQTNEYQGKIYGTLNPSDTVALRFQQTGAIRRYNKYDWAGLIGNLRYGASPGNPENPFLADYNIANRDRLAGNLYVDWTTPVSGLTLTPTAGYRWDAYPTDNALIAQAQANGGTGSSELGLRQDHNFNVGLEASWIVNSNVSLSLSYTYERTHQMMLGATSTSSALALYSGSIDENVHTFTGGATFTLVPDRLSLKLSATHEFASDGWGTSPQAGCVANNAAGTNCGVVAAGYPGYPAQKTNFDHIDATLMYKIDPSLFNQSGGRGEAILQLHYLYERNSVANWQSGIVAPYMYSTLNSSTTAFRDQIYMAGDNPNYAAQALMASVVVKW